MSNFMDVEDFEKKKVRCNCRKENNSLFFHFWLFFPDLQLQMSCLNWTDKKKSNLWDLWYKFMMLKRKKHERLQKKNTWIFRSKKKEKKTMTKKNLYYYSTPSVTQIFVLLHPSLANTVFDQCDYVIKSRKRDWLG